MSGVREGVATDADLTRLREAIALSASAVAHGNHPFGALLVDAGGEVVARAENTVVTGRDVTGHAETNLVRMLGDRSPAELAGCTLVTSCEPCAMCSGAIYWAGVGRVVFGLAESALVDLTGDDPENPTLRLPCREVLGAGQRDVEVVGPLLEDEAIVPHRGFWRA
ncbi:nucleoside deaminase [Nocardioides sp. TRM66260-LWL]|uniref:nucleoside deaminase n=1 Tax=Nocardioides sp. TRM66260-LWL TaxID=2874478 RepID=UPI001CC41102|nr:nucleoside deaminase [Nocardioides sp. TRM66260-LWL]MBZ5733267.1 nucleoside deaminase [Nocardioides sp. TRM66260-LWL]